MTIHERRQRPMISEREKLNLTDQLRNLPDEAYTFMQYFQFQGGCPNACNFCSQDAGSQVTRLTEQGVDYLFGAMKMVIGQEGKNPEGRLQLAGGREKYKVRVVQPFFDDDVFSYPWLGKVIETLHRDFGVNVRVSSVGYSRHNEELQSMHERIVRDLSDAIDSVRFSFSPYPRGWKNRQDYIADYANMLKTYRPLVDKIGSGKKGVNVELRFPPNVNSQTEDLTDTIINGHHVVQTGPYLMVSLESGKKLSRAEITGLEGRSPAISGDSGQYAIFISDSHIGSGNWQDFAREVIEKSKYPESGEFSFIDGDPAIAGRISQVYLLENEDGLFYSADSKFLPDGTFQAIEIYPKGENRPKSGVLDSSRYLLNALVKFKRAKGIGRREQFPQATWDNVDEVIASVKERTVKTAKYDSSTGKFVTMKILPQVEAYRIILHDAGYPPSLFFDPGFTYDSGVIHNMGRAMKLFQGLASAQEIHVSAGELREHYMTYKFEPPWRWAPVPMGNFEREAPRKVTGGRVRHFSRAPQIAVMQLDRENGLLPNRTFYLELPAGSLEVITLDQAMKEGLLPGF